MRILFARNLVWYLFLFFIGTGVLGYVGYQKITEKQTEVQSVRVTRNTIVSTVVVSGKIEAKQSAQLTFPTVGTVQHVYKKEGDSVTAGEVLASLTQDTLVADYNAALQNLQYLESVKAELLRGPTEEARAVTETSVKIAEEDLARVTREQAQLVTSAYETLLSAGLEAYPTDLYNDDIPPTITGNYRCPQEGTYRLNVFGSKANSGYSYDLSGLETGRFSAYTDTPAPLGNCGLMIQFDATERYRSDEWYIPIPNTRSSQYLANQNAHKLALEQQRNAITAAEQALELSRNSEKNLNAVPSAETLRQADANIERARAELAVREAQIADYTIKAPFDGILAEFDIKVGETTAQTKAITLIQEGHYELIARIPEVDIAKVKLNNRVDVFFDAEPNTRHTGSVAFISPLSSQIDGVAYYDTRIMLTEEPLWIREGMNADVEIITEERSGILAIPKHFIIIENDAPFVYVRTGTQNTKTSVALGTQSTDGLVEVLNLTEGTELILP